MKISRGIFFISALFFIGGATVFARPIPNWPPVQMKRPAADTNSPVWHSIKVLPNPHLPEIHFYDKLNPVWWLENSDEPVPPKWYLPDDQHRELKWRFRNSFHNFGFYVVGISDKKFTRSGFYPERNSDPHGGWDLEIARHWIAFLPFISYERPKMNFYFGWREHGAFGMELKFHRHPASS